MAAVAKSDLVINAVDHLGTREYINDVCTRLKVPMVAGSVFRGGFGGEVYAYVPGWSACLKCMEQYAELHGMNISDQIGFSAQEEEMVYGQQIRDFRLSGLAIDINTISSLHAQLALAILFGGEDRTLKPPAFNWLIFGNRPNEYIGGAHFTVKRLYLKPQKGCVCGLDKDHEWPIVANNSNHSYVYEILDETRTSVFGDLLQPVYEWKRTAIRKKMEEGE